MQSVFELTENKLHHLFSQLEIKGSHKYSGEILSGIFRYPNRDFTFKPHISKRLIQYIKNNYDFSLPIVSKHFRSTDGTQKFVFKFNDEQEVETVLMEYYQNYTLCVSSQVGCAMKCSFCYTGTQGLKRNLNGYEIVMQYMAVKELITTTKPITNIVFMGQGEPLHNFDNIKQAVDVLTDKKGISISPTNITVSTSGFIPGLKRFQELGGVNLALSLHSSNPKVRSDLIPLNNKYPLEDVLKEIGNISLRKNQFIEFEYLLIKDLNMSTEAAMELSELIKDKRAIVNLIPFNAFPGSKYQAPGGDEITKFANILKSCGIRTMIRRTRGEDILAACGQLKS